MKKLIIYLIILLTSVSFVTELSFAQNQAVTAAHIGSYENELKAPAAIDVDGDDNVYIADASSHKIFKYSSEGALLKTLIFNGAPASIAIGNNNQLFVGDTKTGIISQIDEAGNQTEFASTAFPVSMVATPDNKLYVADSKLAHVKVFDMLGNLVQIIGNGDFTFPAGIAYDQKNRRILVSEHGGVGPAVQNCGGGMMGSSVPVLKIYAYDLNGNFLSEFGCSGFDDGLFFRTYGLTVSPNGLIYVGDPSLNRISVFSETGVYLNKLGETGDGQLNMPKEIVLNSQNELFAASMNNGKVEIFAVSENYPTVELTSEKPYLCGDDSTLVSFHLSGTGPRTFSYAINESDTVTISTSSTSYNIMVSEESFFQLIKISDEYFSNIESQESLFVEKRPGASASVTVDNEVFCIGEEATVDFGLTGMAPFTINYTVNGETYALENINENLYTISTTLTGNYAIDSISGNGCPASDISGTTEFEIRNAAPQIIMQEQDTTICNGETIPVTVELQGNAPFNFTYTVNGNNPVTIDNITQNQYTFQVSQEGIYAVTHVTDADSSTQCGAGNVEILNYETPNASIYTEDASFCEGGFAEITMNFYGEAPFSFEYEMTETGFGATISNLQKDYFTKRLAEGGTFSILSVSDANCANNTIDEQIFIRSLFNPTSDFVVEQKDLQVYLTNKSQNANAYLWSFGDCNTSTLVNPTHTYTAQGLYTISLTAYSEECGDSTSSQEISVSATNIGTVGNSDELKIYPNPSSGNLTVEAQRAGNRELVILDITGRIIERRALESNRSKLNLQHLDNGIYCLRIHSNNQTTETKLVICK